MIWLYQFLIIAYRFTLPVFPAWRMYCNSFVRAVAIASSPPRRISSFFFFCLWQANSLGLTATNILFPLIVFVNFRQYQAKLFIRHLVVSQGARDMVGDCVKLWDSQDTDLSMCLSRCLKLSTYKFSAGSQQATHNHSSLNANGDRCRDDCWQKSNARSGQAHAGQGECSINAVYYINPAFVFLV